MADPVDSVNSIRQARERILQSMSDLGNTLGRLDVCLQDPSLSAQQKLAEVLSAYGAIIAHFNLVETTTAVDELARHNDNDHWRAFGAESSLEALTFAAYALPNMRDLARRHGHSETLTPGPTAFAGMQRLIAEAYPERAAELRTTFVANDLPVLGFDTPIKRRPTSSAEVEFDDNGLRRVTGLQSEHAAQVAMSTARVGPNGFSAPVTAAPADQVLKARTSVGGVRAWLSSMLSSTASRLVTGLIFFVVAAFASWAGITKWIEELKPADSEPQAAGSGAVVPAATSTDPTRPEQAEDNHSHATSSDGSAGIAPAERPH